MLDGRAWWAGGAGAGVVMDRLGGRSVAVPAQLGDPVELGGALWSLDGPPGCQAGTYRLRRIAGDLSPLPAIAVPFPATRILGSAPDRLIVAAECGATLELASFAPASGAWLRRRIPVGKLGLVTAD